MGGKGVAQTGFQRGHIDALQGAADGGVTGQARTNESASVLRVLPTPLTDRTGRQLATDQSCTYQPE